jgi:hypothetical protein
MKKCYIENNEQHQQTFKPGAVKKLLPVKGI